MPKLKTNRSAAKRFKVTKSGLVKHKKAYLRHLLTSKGRARKRHLRQAGVLTPVESKKMRALVPFL
ncbi:MAG TPA: 50S ribosomal protein L35 [Candidatus Binataceae bacterium]|nr:50S ribosomal protein L35 [Candidatus Binataceae bacterium]